MTWQKVNQLSPCQALDFLPFQGKVNLKDPDHTFCLLEDYGLDPNDIPEEPLYIYFGRFVSEHLQHYISFRQVFILFVFSVKVIVQNWFINWY